MKKQELVSQLANSQDCFFSLQQVILMLNQIEDSPAPLDDKSEKVVTFTKNELRAFMMKFRDYMVDEIENNVDARNLVTDDMCSISIIGREVEVEVDEFNIREIKQSVSGCTDSFLDNIDLFDNYIEIIVNN